MTEPREMTAAEIREEFLGYLESIRDYWLNESRQPDVVDKLDGLVFSILVALDGGSCGLKGAFHLMPTCHESDPEYLKDEGENWWPVNDEAFELARGCPTEVSLHDAWCARKKKKKPADP